MKKSGCIIVARTNSRRLPGKVLLPVLGKPILYWLIKRIKKIGIFEEIILATTTNKSDDVLVRLAIKNKIKFFRGSENNVVKRIYDTALKFNLKTIVEITADCPIIDIDIIRNLFEIYEKNSAEYLNNCNYRSYPDGMDVQIFDIIALQKTIKQTKKTDELEHIGLYQMRNPKKFSTINIIAPKKLSFPSLGLTLDEKKDYIFLKKIMEFFGRKNIYFTCEEIIDLVNNKKSWNKINKKVKRIGSNIYKNR